MSGRVGVWVGGSGVNVNVVLGNVEKASTIDIANIVRESRLKDNMGPPNHVPNCKFGQSRSTTSNCYGTIAGTVTRSQAISSEYIT